MSNINLTLTAGECAVIIDALHNLELRYAELESVAHHNKVNGVAGATGDERYYQIIGEQASDMLLKVKKVFRETQGYKYGL